jgi:hypothetical protein
MREERGESGLSQIGGSPRGSHSVAGAVIVPVGSFPLLAGETVRKEGGIYSIQQPVHRKRECTVKQRT